MIELRSVRNPGALPEPMSDAEIDETLAAWLRGGPVAVRREALENSQERILERVEFHGIAGLLTSALPGAQPMPGSLRARLRDRAVAQAFWEARHTRLLIRVLAALRTGGIVPLLFKGSALAYSHYPDPATRARGDTDLLVAWEEYERAGAILEDLGFAKPLTAGGTVISSEKTFTCRDSAGVKHAIDLHGRLSNSPVLAGLFDHKELLGRAVDLPALASGARSIGAVDALLIACTHRLVHLLSPYYVGGVAHYSADRLIWLYDIHLLARGLSAGDWQSFLTRAKDKGLAGVCGEGLRSAQNALATGLPGLALEVLDDARCEKRRREIPAQYLASSSLGQMALNFFATHGLARKIRFLSEILLPPEAYMRARFADDGQAWLTVLYARRAIRGLRKLRPGGGGAK